MSHADGTGVTTPPRTNAAAPVDNTIKSTPQNRGTASVNEHISLIGVQVEKMRPWIERDIQDTKKCDADVMLQALLQHASCNMETKQPDLLQKCLKAVLPVCNGDVVAADPKKGKDFHSKGIQDKLKDYVLAGKEEKYYAAFILVTNIALACLEGIKVDGMRPAPSAVDMICQQNDLPMFQFHQNQESLRKPDVVFLPSRTSRKAFPRYDGLIGGEHGVTNATAKPENNLPWEDVLACIEFKRTPKKKTPIPKGLYKVKKHDSSNLVYLSVDPLKPNSPTPNSPTPAPTPGPSLQVVQARQPASDPLPRRSGRIAAQGVQAAPLPPSGGLKRKGGEQLGSAAKRLKPGANSNANPDIKRTDVTVQTGLYAAEMFAANLAVNHLLNFIVIDDVIWIWYYDRQGIIQCSGINFIQDLPRFMVLLYALQRFDFHDWGRNTRFLPAPGGKTISITDAVLGPVDLLLHTSHEERVTHYGLQGRATNVVPVTSEVLGQKFNHIEGGMVAKIFWGEENRKSEPDILKNVKEIAEKEESVKGHIPVLLCHEKFTNSTSSIREALDFLEPTIGSRVLYILVFPKLHPITKLHGDELLIVWRQCILCHVELWIGGVFHRDISPGNMMWYRDKLGKLMGVLNDYDLSSLKEKPGPQGNERTGTVPFMALDLLTEEAQRGKVEHLYRHDLESFIWVFIWICFRYSKGALLQPASRRFDEWATLGASTCYVQKRAFLSAFGRCPPPLDVERLTWRLLTQCAQVLKKDLDRRDDQDLAQLVKAGDQSDDDEEDEHEHDNANEDEDEVKDEKSVDGPPGVVKQPVDGLPGVAKKPEDETSEVAIRAFLRMFTETKGWQALERRIHSQ